MRTTADRPQLPVLDGVAILIAASAGTGWLAVASGRVSPGAFVALLASLLCWGGAGTVLAGSPPLRGLIDWGLPAKLVLGYAVVNSTLLALAVLTPFSVIANFALVAGAVVAALAWRRPMLIRGNWSAAPGVAALLVAIVGATLWTRDTLHPLEPSGMVTLVKPWVDGYFHAIQIRTFGDAHGWSDIQDVRLAGVPSNLYHFASYLTPALVRTAGGLSGYETFAGLHVPLGLFMAGLGAAALIASWWGGWAGVGAVAALLLLPDGFQLGGGNPFLGYHWMQQVGPAGGYAVAILAVAWALLLPACREARPGALVVAWLLGALLAAYKAQFFVAAALLLWVLPPFLFAGLSRRARFTWASAAFLLFIVVVAVSQRLSSVPLIQPDVSSTGYFMALVYQYANPGPVTNVFSGWLGPAQSVASNLSAGAAYLVLAVLGPWFLAWVALSVVAARGGDRFTLVFPYLVVANFLLMALGLAMGEPGTATAEELQHRPFVLAYFVVVSWTGGAATRLLLQEGAGLAKRRLIAVLVLAVAMLIPLTVDRRVQALERMGFSYMQVPSSIVEAAAWLRSCAAKGQVIQDSNFDPMFLEAGLSDLRPFVDGSTMRALNSDKETRRRVGLVFELRKARDKETLEAMANSLGIDWFVLGLGEPVWWPAQVVDHPAFESGGVRVYRLR